MIDPRGHAGLEGLPEALGSLCGRDGESSLCAERVHVTFKLNLMSSMWLTKRAVLSPSLATSMSFVANDLQLCCPSRRVRLWEIGHRNQEIERWSEWDNGVHVHLVSARPVFSPLLSHQACASGVRLTASRRLRPGVAARAAGNCQQRPPRTPQTQRTQHSLGTY